MSVSKYFNDLKEKTDLSFLQLSKQIGITYQNIMDYKNDNISNVSPTVLKKLAKFESRTEKEILYDIFKYDLDEDYPDAVLHFFCSKYIEGNSIAFNTSWISPLYKERANFNGSYTKKRISNNITVVQSWSDIKLEHWKLFTQSQNLEYSKDAYVEVFQNEHQYIANVIAFALQRVQTIGDSSIKGYDIIFDNTQEYEYDLVSDYLLHTKYLKVELHKLNLGKE